MSAETCSLKNIATFDSNLGTDPSAGQCQIACLHPVAGLFQKDAQVTALQKCAASVSNNLAANHGKLHEAQLNFYCEKSTFQASFGADLPFDPNSINQNDHRNVSY